MNERIKLLVEKSYIYDKQNDSSVFNKEKFAELIVRECADLVDTLNEAYDAPSTAGKFIKTYFGIEA